MLISDLAKVCKLARARAQPNLWFTPFSVLERLDHVHRQHFPDIAPQAWVLVRLQLDGDTLTMSYSANALEVAELNILDHALWVTDADEGYVVAPVRMGLTRGLVLRLAILKYCVFLGLRRFRVLHDWQSSDRMTAVASPLPIGVVNKMRYGNRKECSL